MKTIEDTELTSFHVDESQLDKDTERLSKILDAKYSPCDINAYVAEQTHLSDTEKHMLLNLMKKYEELFDGTLGEWKGEPYHIELHEGVKPYHDRPYQVPKAYE